MLVWILLIGRQYRLSRDAGQHMFTVSMNVFTQLLLDRILTFLLRRECDTESALSPTVHLLPNIVLLLIACNVGTQLSASRIQSDSRLCEAILLSYKAAAVGERGSPAHSSIEVASPRIPSRPRKRVPEALPPRRKLLKPQVPTSETPLRARRRLVSESPEADSPATPPPARQRLASEGIICLITFLVAVVEISSSQLSTARPRPAPRGGVARLRPVAGIALMCTVAANQTRLMLAASSLSPSHHPST